MLKKFDTMVRVPWYQISVYNGIKVQKMKAWDAYCWWCLLLGHDCTLRMVQKYIVLLYRDYGTVPIFSVTKTISSLIILLPYLPSVNSMWIHTVLLYSENTVIVETFRNRGALFCVCVLITIKLFFKDQPLKEGNCLVDLSSYWL